MIDRQFGSLFLADPSAFPVEVSGEPWGDRERHLDLPGGVLALRGLSASQAELVDREFATVVHLSAPASANPHETNIFRSAPSFFRDFDLEGWIYTLDLDSSPDRLRLAGLRFAGQVPWRDGSPAGLWTANEDRWFQGVIENYLRVMVAHRLLLHDGILLHSSGVVLGGAAFLFVGASGAGKSTLARKARTAGAPILSDDLNAAVEISSEPAVAQLPFTGDLRDQDSVKGTVPLRGILVLDRGDRVACEPLSRSAAAAAIVATAPFVNRGKHNLDVLVATAAELAARVPAATLSSARGSSFAEINRAVHRFFG